jgi:hypothetical protein
LTLEASQARPAPGSVARVELFERFGRSAIYDTAVELEEQMAGLWASAASPGHGICWTGAS